MRFSSWITRPFYLEGLKARIAGLSDGHAPTGNSHRKSWLRGYYDDEPTRKTVLSMKLKGEK